MKRQNNHNRPAANNSRRTLYSGILQATTTGAAFIKSDRGEFFVPKKNLKGAFHGDKVIFYHIPNTADRAEVVKIFERNPSPLAGTLVFDRRSAYVYPDDLRRPTVQIPRPLLNGALGGQKVVCKITAYQRGLPVGKIENVLGEEGELFAEENSIIAEAGLRTEFSEEVLAEGRAAAAEAVYTGGREDLRGKIIFTIDGQDTRDIDDAVSIERDGDGYILGVHIADVTHYVKYNSALDGEAYARGTSVYFPDRVLPMLPKELSNGICSLNQGEDRYALSVEMRFGADGVRKSYRIFESVINSRAKMTYGQVASICGGDGELCRKYGVIAESVMIMRELCQKLERNRSAAGSVDIDVKEAHIYLDGDGKIVIDPPERTVSMRIIEQFMIAANEAVADYAQTNRLPVLYRVHEPPSPQKAEELFTFLKTLGIAVHADINALKPSDFREILNSVKDKPYSAVVNKVVLRSMQKAKYSAKNTGHFGIASQKYCHFTSPIRRYPDITVHRAIKAMLHSNGELATKLYSDAMEQAAKDCSERERTADDTERKTDDLYKLAYMSDRLGEQFDGIISGVTSHGIYCELANTVEGLIPIEDLPADSYELLDDRFMLKGHRHKFKLGDQIKVIIAACDLGRLKVIMKLAN